MSTEQFDDLEGAVQGSTRRTTLKGIAAALGAVALASPLAAAAQDVDAEKRRCRRGYQGAPGDEGSVGPKGPVGVFIAGPTGPTAVGGVTAGPTGAAGASGKRVGPQLVRTSGTVTLDNAVNTGAGNVLVTCPTGAALLSWGFEVPNALVTVQGAALSGNAARVYFDYEPGTFDPATVTATAYALCATSGVTPAARRAGIDKGKGRGKAASKRGRNDNKKK